MNITNELLTDICTLVEMYSDDNGFIYELSLSVSRKNADSISIKLARNESNSVINVINFKNTDVKVYMASDTAHNNGNSRFA